MDTNTLTGKVYIITDWFVKLVFINIIWLLFNIPTIITSVNFLIARSNGELTLALVLLATTIILFFYPATMAMFGVVRALIMKQAHIRTFRTFYQTYKENYLRSMLGGIVFVLIGTVCFFYYLFFDLQAEPIIKYVYYALVLFITMSNLHYFSSNVHFEAPFIASVKNAFLLTIKNPIISFGCSIIVFMLVMISFKLPILLVLGIGSAIATLAFLAFYKRSLVGLENEA